VDADRLTLRTTVPAVGELLTVRRDAVARANTLDETTRSQEFTLLTSDPVVDIPPDLEEPVDHVVVLSGVTHEDQISLLADHEKSSVHGVFGSIRNIRVEGDELIGRVFFASDEDSDRLWTKVREGHVRRISAGFRPRVQPIDLMPGESRNVGGRTYTARERILRVDISTLLRECSLVVFGADPRAVARSSEPTTNRGNVPDKDSTMNFKQWLAALGIDAGSISDTERAALQGTFDALNDTQRAEPAEQAKVKTAHAGRVAAGRVTPPAPAPAPSAADVERAAAEAVRAERARVTAIQALAEGDESLGDTVRSSIEQGHTVERASQEILKKIRGSRGTPASVGIIIGDVNVSREALGLAMTMRAGVDPMRGVEGEARAPRARLAEQANRFRDSSLFDICRMAIQLDGKPVPFGRDDVIRSAVSGGTLTEIFTQSVSAALLAAFVEAGDSTVGLVREADVPDFKTNDRIRTGEAGGLEKLARGATAKHDTISDNKVGYKIARYAKQFVLSDEDIIDDNFSVLVDRPREMGNAARRLRPDLVYAILMSNPNHDVDAKAIFHADHNNLGTGGGSALGSTSLQTAITAIATQTGVNAAAILNLVAKHLVVPPALKYAAAVLLKSAEVREGRGQSATVAQGTYNPLQDEGLSLRQEQRISSGFTDPSSGLAIAGSSTRWFLFGDPNACPTIEVGYLRGTGRQPMVRSFQLDRGQWGVGFDIKHDIGAKGIDYRNMYRSNGA
jgi:hypothetical protein